MQREHVFYCLFFECVYTKLVQVKAIECKVSIFRRFVEMVNRKCTRSVICNWFQRLGCFCNINKFCTGRVTKLSRITEKHTAQMVLKNYCSSHLIMLHRKTIIEPLRRKIRPLSIIYKRKNDPYILLRENKSDLVCREFIEPPYITQSLNRANVKSVVICDSFTSSHDQNPSQYSCRLTARKLKQSNIPRYKDRAPSSASIKIMKAMRNRKCRNEVKRFLRHSTRKSSVLNQMATNYKDYYLKFINQQRIFSQFFSIFKHLHKVTKRSCAKHDLSICVSNSSSILEYSSFKTANFCVSDIKLMMSGDIELNPGPVNSFSNDNRVSLPAYNILQSRLEQVGSRPLDVGGEGDCFFRAISHQLYGDCSHHLDVRTVGVKYMRENPERFIESNIDSSWIEYLGNMSTLGTWCDHLVIQAVADILNLRIHIVESDENFALFNIVEAVGSVHEPTVVYIGHLGEYHYVSTLQLNSRVPNVERNLITMKHVKQKQKRKEYMKKKRLSQSTHNKEKCNQQKKQYMKNKRLNETSENRQKRNQQNKEYMKKKRLSETSENKQKQNEHEKVE